MTLCNVFPVQEPLSYNTQSHSETLLLERFLTEFLTRFLTAASSQEQDLSLRKLYYMNWRKTMISNTNLNPIEDARAYAREAIHETWPTAKEVAQPTAGMYEYDAILVDDETCSIASVSIMHDPDADTFALVENERPATSPKDEATEQTPVFNFDGPIDWDKLAEEHAIAYLRGDLATSSPESYTIEEMKAISDGMFASTAEVEAAMRNDFQGLPPHGQAMMLDFLQKANPDNFDRWTALLLGTMPEPPETGNPADAGQACSHLRTDS